MAMDKPEPVVLSNAEERGGPSPADVISLSLFGNCTLHVGGHRVPLAESAERLLVFLALKGPQRRSYLAGSLWPDVRDDQALTRLRSTLWRLRQQVPALLDTNEQSLGLRPDVVVDVKRVLSAARAAIDGTLEPSGLSDAFAVLADPRELLLGWYEDWVLLERERLTNLRIHALETLVECLLPEGRFAEALDAAMTAVQLDPLRESTHRAVIRVYLAEGNPGSARRQLDRYVSLLRSEFGVGQPTPLMLELLDAAPPASTMELFDPQHQRFVDRLGRVTMDRR